MSVGHVITNGHIVNVTNAYQDSRFNKEIDLDRGFVTRTVLAAPIRNSTGKVVGVFEVVNKLPENKAFNHDDEVILAAFSALSIFITL